MEQTMEVSGFMIDRWAVIASPEGALRLVEAAKTGDFDAQHIVAGIEVLLERYETKEARCCSCSGRVMKPEHASAFGIGVTYVIGFSSMRDHEGNCDGIACLLCQQCSAEQEDAQSVIEVALKVVTREFQVMPLSAVAEA